MKNVVLLLLAVLGLSIAAAHEPAQIVPDVTVKPETVISVEPVSVFTVEQCGNLIVLIVTDSMGELHPYDLDGKTLDDLQRILNKLPNDPTHRINAIAPCGAIKT